MTPSIAQITFDCADAAALANFWSAAFERPVDPGGSAQFTSIGLAPRTDPVFLFIQVPEPKQAKNRMHLDLRAPDHADEVERLVRLGASRLGDYDEHGVRWSSLADPEGNEFDLGTGL